MGSDDRTVPLGQVDDLPVRALIAASHRCMPICRRNLFGGLKDRQAIFPVLPHIGIRAHLPTLGRSMERDVQQTEMARDHLRSAVELSVAEEVFKLDELKASGAISEAEYKTLRGRLV